MTVKTPGAYVYLKGHPGLGYAIVESVEWQTGLINVVFVDDGSNGERYQLDTECLVLV